MTPTTFIDPSGDLHAIKPVSAIYISPVNRWFRTPTQWSVILEYEDEEKWDTTFASREEAEKYRDFLIGILAPDAARP